jgi:hypothetical protein
MLGLTNGEIFVVVFIVVAVVSAPWWARLGEAIFTGFASRRGPRGPRS